LHSLGEAEVKHGVRLQPYNLYTDEIGNRELPEKLRAARKAAAITAAKRKRKKLMMGIFPTALVGLIIASAVYSYYYFRPSHKLSDKDTIVLADFANSTGNAIFDDTLKTALNISLQQMTRPADTKLTPEITREVCVRAGSKAYIVGAIANLGGEYVLRLKAMNCQNGDALATEQATASDKEKVLDSLGDAASRLRGELGESLATVQKFAVRLAEATTSSLEALHAFSLGLKAAKEKGSAASLPYSQHAIQLDPNFAMGYQAAGNDFYNLGQPGRASEYYTKAFQLREHATERERLEITAGYYQEVTGELDKAVQTYQEEIEAYPRDASALINLCGAAETQAQFEKSLQACREALRLNPNNAHSYADLAVTLIALQRFDEARQTIQQALARGLDNLEFHKALYLLAFLRGDSLTMEGQQHWFAGKPEENHGFSLASETEAYAGHLHKARELSKQAIGAAIRVDSKESGALWEEMTAIREAAFGNFADAKHEAENGLELYSSSQGVQVEAALAFAMSGDVIRAESLAQTLNKRYQLNTQMQYLWLPTVHMQLLLNRKKTLLDLKAIDPAPPVELGDIEFAPNVSCLYHTYIRGEAYLASRQGIQAAAEFQKILDHSGIVWNCWTGALARLGVARANALQSRTSQGADADAARVRALAAYKDFLTLWKDADPGIPILQQAKAEYAKLQ
jgi:tetratricopeptide (TPR) repeat protein